MTITLSVPDDIAAAAQQLAEDSGQTAEQLLLDALWAHFPPIPAELRAEFDALESASDEDFVRFEKAEQGDPDAAR
jgi:5'-deoxynucleotidase YfbR-like HD superfamily hydrolase